MRSGANGVAGRPHHDGVIDAPVTTASRTCVATSAPAVERRCGTPSYLAWLSGLAWSYAAAPEAYATEAYASSSGRSSSLRPARSCPKLASGAPSPSATVRQNEFTVWLPCTATG